MRLTLLGGVSALAMAAACATGVELGPLSAGDGSGGTNTAAAGGATGEGTGGGAGTGGNANTEGDAGLGGSPGTGGSGGDAGAAGNSSVGGGAGTGGTANTGGRAGIGGTGGTGGTAGTGGAAGAGGTGGNAGTSGSGGTGGKADGGTAVCNRVISVKSSWVATAAFNGDTALFAVDADVSTRYTSARAQAGDEWLQVDFGATATVNRVTLDTSSPNDYPAHWQVRLTDTSLNLSAPIVIEGDGTAPNIVIQFPAPISGRYLLISQTGAKTPSWWSVHDLNVFCM
jgi:F5/8 type C domain